jgi:hypothetical protein
MGEVLTPCETRTCWVVCDALANGQWFNRSGFLETQEAGERKLRWLRRWHPGAFLVSMVMTPCDSESLNPSLPIQSPQSAPTRRPQLCLV